MKASSGIGAIGWLRDSVGRARSQGRIVIRNNDKTVTPPGEQRQTSAGETRANANVLVIWMNHQRAKSHPAQRASLANYTEQDVPDEGGMYKRHQG